MPTNSASVVSQKFPCIIPRIRLGTASPSNPLNPRKLRDMEGEAELSRCLVFVIDHLWDMTLAAQYLAQSPCFMLKGKMFEHSLATSVPHTLSHTGITGQPQQAVCLGIYVTRATEKACYLIHHCLLHASAGGSDDRESRCHRLDNRYTKALALS